MRAYLSVLPPHILEHDGQLATEDTLEFTLSAEERNRVAGSTSVYCEISSPVRSQPIVSNELWITDVEALKHAHRDPLFDEKVRKFLRDQEVNTAEEWNDLYTLLADIVSLDVVELRKRGGSYTTGPRRKSGRPRLGERVVLAGEDPLDSSEEEDWAREMFHESALNVMLTNAVSRLPSVRRDQDRDVSDGKEDGTGDSDADGDKSGRLRKPLPPNEKVRRRFIGLLRKYTRSLENAEFIATASLYHILGYYVIFQKIAFLLLLSGATGVEEYVDRIRAINHRFFGRPDDPPPVLMSTCQHYVSSTWAREWLEEGVVAFAVAGADFMVALARHEPALYQIREELRADRLRILASLGVVLNLPAYLETPLPGFDAALEMYRQLKGYYSDWVEISLKLERDFPQINQTLSTWQDQAYYRWAKTPHGPEKRQYQRALIDYGQSALSVEQYLGNEGEQIKWCTHLVPHLRNTDEFQRASELHDMSLKLLHDQKQGQELVEALYEQGKELFYAGAAAEAEASWRQARGVAERLGDNPLLQKLDRNITWAKVMASIERAAQGATSADVT